MEMVDGENMTERRAMMTTSPLLSRMADGSSSGFSVPCSGGPDGQGWHVSPSLCDFLNFTHECDGVSSHVWLMSRQFVYPQQRTKGALCAQ